MESELTLPEHDDAEHRLPIPVMESSDLFQGDREVWLEYAGEFYLLRITQAGKLLLTK